MGSWLGSSKKNDVNGELEALRSELAAIANRVSGIAGATGDSLRDNVSQLRASLPDANTITRAANSALDRGRDWVEQADTGVRGGVKEARSAIQHSPVTAIALAAGAGFLVGLLVARSSED